MLHLQTIGCLSLVVLLAAATEKEIPRKRSDNTYLLPNGWALSPAGRQADLGGLPLKLLGIPGSKYVQEVERDPAAYFDGDPVQAQKKGVKREPV